VDPDNAHEAVPDDARIVIDPRFHDGVLFTLAGPVESGTGTPGVSAPVDALVRRLRDTGIATEIVPAESVPAGGADSAGLASTARRLGVRPDRCVSVEQTAAGITAARAAGFGLIVGIAQRGDDAQLLAAGADAVIGDPLDIDVRTEYRRISALPSALSSFEQIDSVVTERSPIIFLDFDGTLSEITDNPDAATLVPAAAAALCVLRATCPIAIVSGRGLSDVRTKVGIGGLWYAGSHGAEISDPDGRFHQNPLADDSVPMLQRAIDELRPQLLAIPGVHIENKRLCVSVHYRNAAAARAAEVTASVQAVGRRHGLRITRGRRVIELRAPGASDKADAMNWIIRQIGAPRTPMPIYIGDDLTDEDGLDAVRLDGIGMVVRHDEDGDRATAAHFALDSPQEVTELLSRLALALPHRTHPDRAAWSIVFDGYQAASERLREVLCAVGNGALVTRAAAPEADRGPDHYPGTYVAGVYNRMSDVIDGVTISNESLVNLPNWLPLSFRIEGGAWFDIEDCNLLSYRQTMRIRQAECVREMVFEDPAGRRTALTQRRFASMHDPHVCALTTTIVAENWSGSVEFRSTTDTGVINCGVKRYGALSGRHLGSISITDLPGGCVLVDATTVQSRVPIAVATRTTLWRGDRRADTTARHLNEPSRTGYEFHCEVTLGEELTVEKTAVIFTGHDNAISAPHDAALQHLPGLGRYDDLLDAHRESWRQLWQKFDFDLPFPDESVRILRLHMMHLLQTISPNSNDLDVGVPARGLHGEAYRGHIFWDELFVIPLLTLRLPEVSRSLLGYRSRRLPQARRTAAACGYAGAMYPWQSGSDGAEESQKLHLNPLSGRWNADSSHLAHHIGSAVAYNVWQYYQITGDLQYLIEHGAEVIVEVARFWVSRSRLDDTRGKYVINGVIGPDEFHSGYPHRPHEGVDNNAYTNVMAVWVILRAFDVLDALPLPDRLDLLDRLQIASAELAQWETVSRRMFLPFHDGVISQFEGYERLQELDWAGYRKRYEDIGRLDRILESEGDDINRYKASKQADVLMLFYLLSADELRELFARLGYSFRAHQIPQTIDYYLGRTSHGSTLSAVVHSWVSARGNRDRAMHYFDQVLQSDVTDVQGGTTAEGIHLAAMAGSLDLLQRCFTGLEARGNRLILGPMWPEDAGRLKSSLWYRGHRLRLTISGRNAQITADPTGALPIEIECRGHVQTLVSGQTLHIG